MHRFRVWAPGRRTVKLVADGRTLAMAPADQGWWEVSDESAGAGTRYGYSLDGGEVRPDPRSASQPGGVLGLSEVVDQAAYSWTDGGWKGRGLWSTYAGRAPYHIEGGKGTTSKVVHFQLRPDPLAR